MGSGKNWPTVSKVDSRMVGRGLPVVNLGFPRVMSNPYGRRIVGGGDG